jgi:hypothetical protein
MTIFGKLFVYLILCMSLITLGIAVWVSIDRREWQKERQAIGAEIYARQKAFEYQRSSLVMLLDEIRKGARQMPWDPETGATPRTVSETIGQVKALSLENDKLFSDLGLQRVQHAGLVTSLAQERENYVKATAEQKRLRLEIKPDDPNQKGFRDIIADHKKGKEDAEAAQEGIKPDVMNELVRVAKVKSRLDELAARLKELRAGGVGGSARKP